MSILPNPAATGPPQSGPSPIPFDEFRARLLALYEPPQRDMETFRRMRNVLADVASLEGVCSTADLTTETVRRYIAGRPVKEHPNTTYGLVASLRTACNIAAAEGYVHVSPFSIRKHWVRKVTPKAPKVHSRREIARVLALMEADAAGRRGWARWRALRLQALASTVAYTGIRRSEALYLLTTDIDLDARLLLIVARGRSRLKTEASAQPVPMPDALAAILSAWLPHCASIWAFPNAEHSGPWIGGSVGHRPLDRLKTLGERANVRGLTFSSLRHSYATHAEYWGLSDVQIQRVLRHSNIRTQHHYRHAEMNNLRAIVGGIDFRATPDADAEGGGR
ncbi:MAG: site-specific integrase [Singulisphaera sp.]